MNDSADSKIRSFVKYGDEMKGALPLTALTNRSLKLFAQCRLVPPSTIYPMKLPVSIIVANGKMNLQPACARARNSLRYFSPFTLCFGTESISNNIELSIR